jgi:hypothetical protein
MNHIELLTSQYKLSPRLLDWTSAVLDKVGEANATGELMSLELDIDQAVGVQLDLLGGILGQGRQVGFQPTDGSSPILGDATYRVLLKARVAQNHWDGKVASLYPVWQDLFPGGSIVISDSQEMSANVSLSGSFTSIIRELIEKGYIVPRPQGVLYSYNFGTTPYFGYDYDNTFISGYDTGNLV